MKEQDIVIKIKDELERTLCDVPFVEFPQKVEIQLLAAQEGGDSLIRG